MSKPPLKTNVGQRERHNVRKKGNGIASVGQQGLAVSHWRIGLGQTGNPDSFFIFSSALGMAFHCFSWFLHAFHCFSDCFCAKQTGCQQGLVDPLFSFWWISEKQKSSKVDTHPHTHTKHIQKHHETSPSTAHYQEFMPFPEFKQSVAKDWSTLGSVWYFRHSSQEMSRISKNAHSLPFPTLWSSLIFNASRSGSFFIFLSAACHCMPSGCLPRQSASLWITLDWKWWKLRASCRKPLMATLLKSTLSVGNAIFSFFILFSIIAGGSLCCSVIAVSPWVVDSIFKMVQAAFDLGQALFTFWLFPQEALADRWRQVRFILPAPFCGLNIYQEPHRTSTAGLPDLYPALAIEFHLDIHARAVHLDLHIVFSHSPLVFGHGVNWCQLWLTTLKGGTDAQWGPTTLLNLLWTKQVTNCAVSSSNTVEIIWKPSRFRRCNSAINPNKSYCQICSTYIYI